MRWVLLVGVMTMAVACGSDGTDDAADPVPDVGSEDEGGVEGPDGDAEVGDDQADDDLAERSEEPASFAVDGTVAEMIGLIGPSTPDAVRELLDEAPDLETIVLVAVPGSEDDVSNLEASRLIRDAGLATHVPADGFIASGGVDFYLAGVDRTYEDGARFGVHSWAAGDGRNGDELPRDDPEHDLFLDYYDEIGIDPEFYWFTLESAPPEDLHFMTTDELARFDVGELVDALD